MLLLAATVMFTTAHVLAQPVPDHLKCYKIKDSAAKATVHG